MLPIAALAFLGVSLAACSSSTGGSPVNPPPSTPTDLTSSADPTTTTVSRTVTTPSTQPTTTTTTTPPPPVPPPPPELVGEWSASTAETGLLELSIDSNGAFHHHDGRQLDDRGTISVRGAQITFHNTDGSVVTLDWSLRGGTLVLAGITYLRTSGPDGVLALAGEWIGIDDVFETLVFDANGGFARKHELTGVESGTFHVQGNKLTMSLQNGPSSTVTWSIDDAKLTLVDAAGTARQYARLS